MLADCCYFRDVRKTLIEVKYSDFFALFDHLDFVLFLYCGVVDEHRVTLLHLDEAGMLMKSLPDYLVTLVVLL